jgi:hypothetical protein
VADVTAEITKKLRDYQNRIERLEKVEALSLSDELAHALGAGIAASAGVALDASRHDHIHEITASDNPGGKVSLLQTDASGHLTIVQLNTTANHTTTTLTDHIGEHTGHGVVVDSNMTLSASGGNVVNCGAATGGVLRRVYILIENGTSAAHIKCSSVSRWNGDANGAQDNIGKDGVATGVWSLNATGTVLSWLGTGISGNPITVLAAYTLDNFSGTAINIDSAVTATAIYMGFNNAATGAAVDLTTLVDTGSIYVELLYMTTA